MTLNSDSQDSNGKLIDDDLSVKEAYLEHKSTLVSYIAKYLLRPEDVEDILQEAFLRTLVASRKKTIASPKSYLFIVARNLVFRNLRNQSKKVMEKIEDVDEKYLVSQDVGTDKKFYDKMKMKAFVEAANSLPPQCRKVFLMRKLLGKSQREISKELGISISTVERHITNAIKRCRSTMFDEGYVVGQRNEIIYKQRRGNPNE